MQCPICQGDTRRFGKNRNGSQRLRCDACKVTFTDEATRPRDGRTLSEEKLVLVLRMLLEGNSIRSVERITSIHRDTIMHSMVEVGQKCERFLAERIRGIDVEDVQADEIWSFVKMKEKTRILNNLPEDTLGDCYCYTAIERNTKLIVAWHVGKRCPDDTYTFAAKLRAATVGDFQLTTDGYTPYRTAVPEVFGHSLHFAQLIKEYGLSEDDSRYSPAVVTGITIKIRSGDPDAASICTSHVERHNRQIRMQTRRLTRLVDAHSKKWENHQAALALFFAYYNFCRVHSTIETTPAVASGLASEPWSVQRLLAAIG
jgi:transposase-like protein/IS1 family transposase